MSRWWAPALVALAFFAGLGVRVGSADGFHFLAPVQASSRYALPEVLLPGQPVREGDGYDGQFYFYLGQDPFLTRPATVRALDNTFRVRRIAYPLLGWALSGGDRARLPLVLVLLNVLAGTALAGLAAAAAARAGRSPWWSLPLVLYPGVWVPVLGDLTEPLQLTFLVAGMTFSSAPLLLLAGLAKETAGVALVTEAARHAWESRWRSAAGHGILAALLVAWALFVHWAVTGAHHDDLGAHFLEPPGAPFRLLLAGGPRTVILAPAVLVCVLAVARLAVARDGPALAAAAYALLALGAGDDTWLDAAAYFRVTAGALALTYLSWCGARDRLGLAALLLGAAAGAATLPVLLG